jgi:MFS family permease
MQPDARDQAIAESAGGQAATDPPRGYVRRTFLSLRVRNFRLFLGGQLISATGTWMQWTAAPLLVLQLTGSGVALGIDTALTFLPILLFGAWGGVFADRFDNRRLLMWTQGAFAVLATSLWALVAAGVVEVWMVYTISFLGGVVLAVDMPTRQSFYLEMVGPADLTNAMSLNTATFTGSRIAGPVLAAVMIAAFGMAPVFLVNAVSFLPVVAALGLMRREELRPRQRVPRQRGQIREGIRYVWGHPRLRLVMLVMGGVFFFGFNYVVLLPLMAVRTFQGDVETYGHMLAVFGVGSLIGALVMAGRSAKANVRLLAVLAVAFGASTVALAVAPTYPVALALAFPLGATGLAFAITANATLQLNSDELMRGRVMALYTVVFLGSTPISGPLAGWIGEQFGPRIGLAGGGVLAAVAGLAGLAALAGRLGPAGMREHVPARAAAAEADGSSPR